MRCNGLFSCGLLKELDDFFSTDLASFRHSWMAQNSRFILSGFLGPGQ